MARRVPTALLLVGGSFAAQGLTAVTGIVSARLLGVEGRGQVALVGAAAVLTSQLTLGGSLPNAIAQQLARHARPALDGLRGLGRRWVLWGLAVAVVTGVYVLVALRDLGLGTAATLGVLTLVLTGQTIAYRMLVGGLQGEGDPWRMVVAGLAPQALVAALFVVVFAAGVDVEPWQLLVGQAVMTAVGLALGVRQLAPRRGEPPLDRAELARVTRSTYVGSIGPIDGLALDRNLVGVLLGGAALGLYSAATALANLSSIIGSALGLVVLPRVAAAHDDPAQQRRVLREWFAVGVVTIVLTVLLLEAVAEPVIRFAFGSEFLPAVPCTRLLLVADGVLGFRRLLIAGLQGLGRGARASLIEVVLTPVVVGGIVVAALHDSLPGVGIALLVVAVLSCAALAFSTRAQPAPLA